MTSVLAQDHWGTGEDTRCRLFPAPPEQNNLPKAGGVSVPEGLTGSGPAWFKHSDQKDKVLSLQHWQCYRILQPTPWETFHDGFNFCSLYKKKLKNRWCTKIIRTWKVSSVRTGSISSSLWLWTFAKVPWASAWRLNGLEFAEVLHLFRSKCVIRISRPWMISVYHRDSGGEIQSKNLLVKRGMFCKAVLQISKKHGVSFQGFCGVFLDCGIR